MKTLIPFTVTPFTQPFQVSADFFQVSPQKALLEFKIVGPLAHIVWPSSSVIESRQDGLWQTTCLEAFFAPGNKAEDAYFEINCSPNGDWNAYSFSSYRQGMIAAEGVEVRVKERSSEGNEAFFRIEISSDQPFQAKSLALCAVIEFSNGEKSYWALKHPSAKADFHNKDAWDSATH